MKINWQDQHCGLHRSTIEDCEKLMPDVYELIDNSFPSEKENYVFDVKVHMLMPGQYPCIPNWHFDNIPRVNNKQDFSKVDLSKDMWLFVSGEPLTEFERKDGIRYIIKANQWHKFYQCDLHRGRMSDEFQWRGFIRATHKDILRPNENPLRRHSQVYLDAEKFRW